MGWRTPFAPGSSTGHLETCRCQSDLEAMGSEVVLDEPYSGGAKIIIIINLFFPHLISTVQLFQLASVCYSNNNYL